MSNPRWFATNLDSEMQEGSQEISAAAHSSRKVCPGVKFSEADTFVHTTTPSLHNMHTDHAQQRCGYVRRHLHNHLHNHAVGSGPSHFSAWPSLWPLCSERLWQDIHGGVRTAEMDSAIDSACRGSGEAAKIAGGRKGAQTLGCWGTRQAARIRGCLNKNGLSEGERR